jgi:hypothetical protein
MRMIVWWHDEESGHIVSREVFDFPKHPETFLRVFAVKGKPWKGYSSRRLTAAEFEIELRKGLPKPLA